MDARHEFYIQELLNEIITAINYFIREEQDPLLLNPSLLSDIKKVAHAVFACAGKNVEVEEILSKQNLLSTNVVFLPLLEEAVLCSEADFSLVAETIEAINKTPAVPHPFYFQVLTILKKDRLS